MSDSKYFCYIDESGDPSNPLDSNDNQILRSSTMYTLAGIFADKKTKLEMEKEHANIINKYFSKTKLPENFYLHYHSIRQNHSPYDTLTNNEKLCLIDDIFNVIKNSDCVLFSITLDLETHYKSYPDPLHPQAYTLILFIERLINYITTNHIGSVYVEYERFYHALRNNCIESYKKINSRTNFKTRLDVSKILKLITYGDPCNSILLQFADFWAFIPYSKRTSKLYFDKFQSHFKDNGMRKEKNGNYFINEEADFFKK